MKVLIISQPALSKSNNMGKTLMGYFSNFDAKDVSQLFLREGTPTNTDVCENYYCFSDSDAIKSIFDPRVKGRAFTRESMRALNKGEEASVKIDDAYKLGAAHKAWMLMIRDAIWKLSRWKNKKLLSWLDSNSPDIVFLAPGDGAFSYRVANGISKYLHKPLVMVCVDDYFINNRNKKELLGKMRQVQFMRVVSRTVHNCAVIFTICDEMNKAYSALFGKKCFTLHTTAEYKEVALNAAANNVSYIGNLSCGRCKSLLDMGRKLSEIKDDKLPKRIDVYSNSKEEEYIALLKNAQGICFHGAIPAEDVPKIMGNSMAVIHTESFEPEMMDLVRFSVSTKIAESLMYGPCLIAYGPEGIASIDYLKENSAAYVITRTEDLESGLSEILTNRDMREHIIKNARALAAKNHNAEVNPKRVRMWLQQAVDNSKVRSNGE